MRLGMHTEAINHDPDTINTGHQFRVTQAWGVGEWSGSKTKYAGSRRLFQVVGKNLAANIFKTGAVFLPSVHQGVQLRSSGDPILYLKT